MTNELVLTSSQQKFINKLEELNVNYRVEKRLVKHGKGSRITSETNIRVWRHSELGPRHECADCGQEHYPVLVKDFSARATWKDGRFRAASARGLGIRGADHSLAVLLTRLEREVYPPRKVEADSGSS